MREGMPQMSERDRLKADVQRDALNADRIQEEKNRAYEALAKKALIEDPNIEVKGKRFSTGVQIVPGIGPYDGSPSGLELDTDRKEFNLGVQKDLTEELLHSPDERSIDPRDLASRSTDKLDIHKAGANSAKRNIHIIKNDDAEAA